jgi:hypothetical protein
MSSKKNLTYLCLFIFIIISCIIAYNIYMSYNSYNSYNNTENVIETFESKLQKLKNKKSHEKFGDIAEKIKKKMKKINKIKEMTSKEDKRKDHMKKKRTKARDWDKYWAKHAGKNQNDIDDDEYDEDEYDDEDNKNTDNFVDVDDSNNSNNNNNLTRRVFNNLSTYKSNNEYTIDDVIDRSERLKTNKMSMDYIKNELMKYYNSFKKEKFANNSPNTREALNKFPLYKEKFFEIFKSD